MSRYPNKPQALVDYAGILGLASLRDGSGKILATSRPGLPLPHVSDGVLVRVPGTPCTQSSEHVLKIGGYTLTVISSPGLSPHAVETRLQGCKRLLRALGAAGLPWLPPGEGQGGSGPAGAELRVWPPSGGKPS